MNEKSFVEVRYLQIGLHLNEDDGIGGARIEVRAGTSGSTRMLLEHVPNWLEVNPGTMIVAILPA